MNFNFYLLCFVLSIATGNATTYYISNKGVDEASGLSPGRAWQSLNKLRLQSKFILPGDSILLERGSIFNGSLSVALSGSSGSEIYIGAFGTGEKPLITGAMEVRGWKPFGRNIWVAECTACPADLSTLFIEKKFQVPGRFPNTGYRPLSNTSDSRTSFRDLDLLASDGKWNTAEVVVKSSRWVIDKIRIASFKTNTFFLSSPTSYPLENGFGYFIQKHISTLDTNGEWFFDSAKKKIFLFADAGLDINKKLIEVSALEFGLDVVNSHYVLIENLSFANYHQAGIRINSSSNIELKFCESSFSGRVGLDVSFCSNICVDNTQITDSNNNGVEWRNNRNGLFTHNAILRTGLHPGLGGSGDGTYIALSVLSSKILEGKNLFQYNVIDSTGYLGIDFRTGNNEIKNNVIRNFCMTKDDGAGIYTWENAFDNNVIEGNVITNGVGSAEGTNSNQLYANGIYIDDRSSNILIKDNMIANCAMAGIYIHNAQKIVIQGNTLFGNGNAINNKERGQLLIKRDSLFAGQKNDFKFLVVNNTFVATNETVPVLFFSIRSMEDFNVLGVFSKNDYIAVSKNNIVAEMYGKQDFCETPELYTLAAWQLARNQESNSIVSYFSFSPPDQKVTNLLTNGDMKAGTTNWHTWPEQTSVHLQKGTGLTVPSLQVDTHGQAEAMVYHAGFSLEQQKTYRLSFSVKSQTNSKIEFVPMMSEAPWLALGNYTCFTVDSVQQDFVYYFKPSQDCKQARVNFKSTSSFLINNVLLYEMPKSLTENTIRLVCNILAKPILIKAPAEFMVADGEPVSDSLTLPAFTSVVLVNRRALTKHKRP